jgi:glycosyltransferase involved in cell wall biosynthesis
MGTRIILGYGGSLDYFGGKKPARTWLKYFWTYNHESTDKTTRSPYYLFHAVKKLHDRKVISPGQFQMLFWGAIDPRNVELAETLGIKKYLDVKGYINKAESLQLLGSCSLLFLPLESRGTGEPLFIPGKLFEYLSTGKPVLALCDPESDAGRIISDSGMGIICEPDNVAHIADSLQQIIIHPEQLSGRSPNHTFISKFSWKETTRRMAAVLSGL